MIFTEEILTSSLIDGDEEELIGEGKEEEDNAEEAEEEI